MTTTTTPHAHEMPAELPCHVCDYDLRAQPADGACPECGASVEDARKFAAIPRRPAWRDSDPRWRRRMIAGAWVLVLLPLMDVLRTFNLVSSVPVPSLFGPRDTTRTLDEKLVNGMYIYPSLAFCVGVVLLFAKERGRRRNRLDWTRRWGVLCCYAVLLLCAAPVLYISALVSCGIGALFVGIPIHRQPAITPTLIDVSAFYLRYGPQPGNWADIVLTAFSSTAILFACVALYDALRSSGPPRLARVVLAPLAIFAAFYLAQVLRFCIGFPRMSPGAFDHGIYFYPELVALHAAGPGVRPAPNVPGSVLSNAAAEAVKWCAVLSVAVWLSVAQVAAWRKRGRAD